MTSLAEVYLDTLNLHSFCNKIDIILLEVKVKEERTASVSLCIENIQCLFKKYKSLQLVVAHCSKYSVGRGNSVP